jgi:hypothetical protein
LTGFKKLFEGLVWKYANAVEGEGNDKAVHNIKADTLNRDIDDFIYNGVTGHRLGEVLSIMHDFGPTMSATESQLTISFTATSRWAGSEEAMTTLVTRYMLDGLMVDWLNVTAPTEAAIYATKLQQDKTNIETELYKRGTPL